MMFYKSVYVHQTYCFSLLTLQIENGLNPYKYLARNESKSIVIADGYWFGFEILRESVDDASTVISTENISNAIGNVINNSKYQAKWKQIDI